MIIPVACFTCGKPIDHLYDEYLEMVYRFKIEAQTSGVKDGTSPEFKALARVGLHRECCRRMFLAQIPDLYSKIT